MRPSTRPQVRAPGLTRCHSREHARTEGVHAPAGTRLTDATSAARRDSPGEDAAAVVDIEAGANGCDVLRCDDNGEVGIAAQDPTR